VGPSSRTVYCVDTSTLIDLKGFPRDIFEVWGSIEDLIEKDSLIAPKQVREELKAWDDELYPWAVRHKRMFRVLTRDQARCVAEIVAEFPGLAHTERRVEAADPFVIALALAEKRGSLFGTDYVVVTSEKRKRGKKNIPGACDHLGVRCLGLFDFMRAEGWTFVRGRGE
jgi:hypothetical protein